MFMKRILYVAFALSTFSMASCEKDVDLKVPPFQPKLAIGCITQLHGMHSIGVYKSYTIKAKSTYDSSIVSNAVIELYENGQLQGTPLTYNPFLMEYPSLLVAKPGAQYRIKVTAPGYIAAEATTTVPDSVLITNVNHRVNARLDPDGNQQDELIVEFTDPITVNDYYVMKIYNSTQGLIGGLYGYECVNTTDPSVEPVTSDFVDANACYDNLNIFIRDVTFNGSRKQLKLYASPYLLAPYIDIAGDTTYPHVTLQHVTESYFKHLKSLHVADQNNGDPFSEPVNVFSNITNGYGIFTVFSEDRREIR